MMPKELRPSSPVRNERATAGRDGDSPDGSPHEAPRVERRRVTDHLAQRLGEMNRQLEAIIEASPLAIITLDREGLIRSWNPAAERIYGWTEAEVLGQPLPTVPPEMRAEMERNHADAVRGKNFVNFETRRQRKDGTTVEVSISTAPLLDDEGAHSGVVALVADITERKRAAADLFRFAAIVENSADAIISKDLDGTILSWNPGAEQLYGYTAAEAVGQPITILIPTDRPDEEPQIIDQIERGERVKHYETVRRRKDGTLVNVSLTVSPVRDSDGRIIGASTIARDITERRRAEDEKLRLAAQVEGERRRLKELVANVPGVVWEAWGEPDAASQRIDFVSDYVEQMLGYTVEEWLATPNFWLTIVHPEDRERAAREARRKFDSRRGGTSQFRWVCKDGRVIEVETQSLVICDERGEPVGMRGVTMDITERKRASELLRQSEERYRVFVAQSSEAIWRIEFDTPIPVNLPEDEQIERYYADGALAECNDVMARMYGFSHAEELRGVRLGEMLPRTPDNLAYLRAAIRSGYRLIDAESQEVDRDGNRKYFLNNLVGIVEGRLLRRVWGTQRDVTERKAAEEAVRENERRLQVVTDSAPVFIAYCDAEARFIFVNQPYADRFHLGREAIIGKHISEVVGEEAYREFKQYVDAALSGRRVEFEIEIPYRSLGRRFVHTIYAPRFGDGGEVQGFVAVITDVTERRRDEESRKFLSDATTVLASSLDYAATLDAVAHMAAHYLTDYCLIDLIEDDGAIRRLVAAHRDPAREAAWREMQQRFPVAPGSPHTVVKVLETGEPDLLTDMTDEVLARAIPDAEHIEQLKRLGVRSAMTVPLTARGRIVGAISLISAESARRYTADDLRLAEELAHRAALAVDNARLYQRAQEANRAKDEFLATLSHELRTPLTPIIGWVHLLGGGQVAPPDLTHGLEVIDKNSQALSRLINDLLDMSAILNGKMRIDRAPVRAESVLREAVETVRAQADRRGVRIEMTGCEDDEDGATVSGDRTRLAQVFWNLLTNAVKFSADGGRIRVSCERDAKVLRVHVEDEGVGIQPEFLPYVFERFRQADMSTTKLYGGLGIGLALVRSFVEAHGGTVRAESAGAGRGSRFTVQLPLAELRIADCGLRIADETASVSESAPLSTPTSSAAQKLDASVPQSAIRNPQSAIESSAIRNPQSSPRVLVIEDAPDTLEMLRLFFAARGFAPTACASSEEALDVAAREHFDIIVSDIGLPHIDGYELLRRLRRDAPHLASSPALALTGYAAETDVATARAAGFEAHLAKPFEPAALADAVEKLLAGRAPDGAA
jgi:PAS domain S-box-containing protein